MSVASPARQARSHYRHDLRTLTYVTLDGGNGGIVRNLTDAGIGVQAVAAPRAGQNVRIRFELRNPRLRIEAQGQVMWGTATGQCGIRFVELPCTTARHINEWIFGNLIESIPQHSGWKDSIFADVSPAVREEGGDGLVLSGAQPKVIPLVANVEEADSGEESQTASRVDWLSQPLSARGLALAVDILAVIAAFLLFSTTFLAITQHLPRWPMNLLLGLTAASLVMAFYCAFCYAFGGESFGTKLGRLLDRDSGEDQEEGDRFR